MVLKQHLNYYRDDPDHPLGLNTNSYYPRPHLDNGKNYQVQSMYLQNAAYMRIKNLQLGYTLPSRITNKIGITNCRIFDLFDPETIGENGEGNVYPLTKTYSMGLSVTF
jgi:hypothetical protein